MTINDNCIKIVTPIGMLGYGYSKDLLMKGIAMGASAIIIDSGSTDGGPQKLALGIPGRPRELYEKDLKPILDACWHHRVKVLIGSAGGNGINSHVDFLCQIIQDYATEKDYRFKMIKIYAEVASDVVHQAFDRGQVASCASAPPLEKGEIDQAVRIVAQMGMEPFVKAMEDEPDFDIIIAGRAYDPAPYAAYCYVNGITDLGIAYHMGKVMECGAVCCTPKSKEALATIWSDRFEITPLQENARCTLGSLAAHTLYEKTRPDLLLGPGGTLDLRRTEYLESDDGVSCQSKGAQFIPANPYTIKLEGAKVTGYRTIFFGAIRDPILISQIDWFLEKIQVYVKSAFSDYKFDIKFSVYGRDGVMENFEFNQQILGKEIGVLCQVQAETQDIATMVAAAAQTGIIHGPYPFQQATAGNFAMPFNPLQVPLGPVSQFTIYHVMEIDDPLAYFPISVELVGASETTTTARDLNFGMELSATSKKSVEQASLGLLYQAIQEKEKHEISPLKKEDGVTFLWEIAKVVRSKNAGPFEVTFDVLFQDREAFDRARSSPAFNVDNVASLYRIPSEKVVACLFFEQALAFKFTIPRWQANGGFGERDVHASQQHVPLMFMKI